MRNKLLVIIFLMIVSAFCAVGFTACEKQGDDADGRDPQIVKIYNAYVAYAEENDITPLSYEAWLLSVKGEKGDKGEDGFTPTVEISTDGYWVINGVKTGSKSKGEDGKITVVEISSDGYWIINGVKTGDVATDTDGKTYYDLYVEFPVWLETTAADDFDGDRDVTFADFMYYKEYKNWKLSGNAFDYDGDRVITLDDFAFYKDPQNENLFTWLDSDIAYDYNGDGFVDKADFIIYHNNYKSIVGKFKVVNFNCQQNDNQGRDRQILLNDNYYLSDLAQDIGNFDFEVSKDLKLSCVYGDTVKQKLGEDENAVLSAINACEFDILTAALMTATFTIKELTFTVYLTKADGGFSSSINYVVGNISASITFNITYVE